MRLDLICLLGVLTACAGAPKAQQEIIPYAFQQDAQKIASYLKDNGIKDTNYIGRVCWRKEKVLREDGVNIDLAVCEFEKKKGQENHSNMAFLEVTDRKNISSMTAFDPYLMGFGRLCQVKENGFVVEEVENDEGCDKFYRTILAKLKTKNLAGLTNSLAEDSHK